MPQVWKSLLTERREREKGKEARTQPQGTPALRDQAKEPTKEGARDREV